MEEEEKEMKTTVRSVPDGSDKELKRIAQKFFTLGYDYCYCYLCSLSVFNIFPKDWWNVIVWDNPGMLHPLPCGFNYQTADKLNYGPWKKVWCPLEIE